ncbi:hypothetical protein DFAR_400009 [Desulfarculales bacterium]
MLGEELIRRGYRNNMLAALVNQEALAWPWWRDRSEFHAAHRASLLRRGPVHYGRYGWDDATILPDWWLNQHIEEA